MNEVYASLESLRFTVSGAGDLWTVLPDESLVLKSYQDVRDVGSGSIYIEFASGRATKFDVKHGGGAAMLNSFLPGPKKLREVE